MAEKVPELKVTEPESPAIEKKKSDVSGASDDRADESGETGKASAQSSDLLSGVEATTESAMETSEDHGCKPVVSQEPVPRTKKQQKSGKSSKNQVEDDSKPERSVSRSPDKSSRTRSHKKSTSEKETDVSKESDEKTALEGSPAKGAPTPLKAGTTPPKSKSPSILMRLRSHSKLRSARSSSVPPEGSAKADEARGKAKVEKSSEIYSPAKRRGPFGKAKSVDRERSKPTTRRNESMDTSETEPDLKETDEKASKTKSKASVKPKLPLKKQEKEDANKLIAEETQQVSSGIQSIQLSKQANDAVSLCLEESIDSKSSSASGKEEIGTGEATKVKEIGAGDGAASHWKSQHSRQEGKFQKDAIWAQLSSSGEDNGTEVSVVSPSSALKGGNELKQGLSTSTDTLSEIPSLKEEEASRGQELAEKSPRQGQKRVQFKESSDSDEE